MCGAKENKIPIIYILGTPYCGSTLMGFILGSSPQIFNAGEIQHFRRFSDIGMRKCSCGVKVSLCPVWRQISFSNYHLFSKASRKEQLFALWNILLLNRLPDYKKEFHDEVVFFKDLFSALHKTEEKEAKYILDNSKTPFRLIHLLNYPELDIHILYLRRSIHGNIASSLKAKESFAWALLRYLLINLCCERLLILSHRPFLRISYEQFCKYPEKELARIGNFLDVVFPDDIVKAVKERSYHVFTGSVWRFKITTDFKGIFLDQSWKFRLSGWQIHLLDILNAIM